jgi:hypothetical protein
MGMSIPILWEKYDHNHSTLPILQVVLFGIGRKEWMFLS